MKIGKKREPHRRCSAGPKNPVHTHGVVEPVSEGSVFLGIGPVRNRPRIVIPSDTAACRRSHSAARYWQAKGRRGPGKTAGGYSLQVRRKHPGPHFGGIRDSPARSQPDRHGEDFPRCRSRLQGGPGRHHRESQTGIRRDGESETVEASAQTAAKGGEEASRPAVNSGNSRGTSNHRLRILLSAVRLPPFSMPARARATSWSRPTGSAARRPAFILSALILEGIDWKGSPCRYWPQRRQARSSRESFRRSKLDCWFQYFVAEPCIVALSRHQAADASEPPF